MSDCRYVCDCISRGASSIPAYFHAFVEIDHEIISMTILLPSADSRRVVVSYKRKHVHKVQVNCLADRPDMTIAVDWDVMHQTKQTSHGNIDFSIYLKAVIEATRLCTQ